MHPIFSNKKQKLLVALIYTYAAWLILQIFVAKFGLDALEKATFLDSIGGSAHRPYVYRALIPAIIRSVADIIPQTVAVLFNQLFYQPEVLPTKATNWGLPYVLFCVLTWACFVGFAYCIRWLTRYFYPEYSSGIIDFGVPLASLFGLPLFFRHVNFVYDPGTILLFPLAIICILQERYLLYVLILALCALNKETSILLVIPFLIHARQRGLKVVPTIGLALLQIGISLGIYAYIRHSFRDRPGVPMELQLYTYNVLLPIHSPFAFVWLVAIVSTVAYLVTRDWKTKPLFLRQSFVCVLIPHSAFLLVVGCIDEIRIFYEVYALLILLITPSILKLLSRIGAQSQEVVTGV